MTKNLEVVDIKDINSIVLKDPAFSFGLNLICNSLNKNMQDEILAMRLEHKGFLITISKLEANNE